MVACSACDEREVGREELFELLFALLGDGEDLLKRVLHRSWLLVNFLQHEMGEPSLRGSVLVEPVFIYWEVLWLQVDIENAVRVSV